MALIKYVNYPGRPCVCWFRLLNLHSTAQVPPLLALKWKYWSFTLAAILWDSHRIPDGFLMESRGIAGTRVSLRDSFFPILGWFIPSRSFPARFPTDSMRSRVISVSFPCHFSSLLLIKEQRAIYGPTYRGGPFGGEWGILFFLFFWGGEGVAHPSFF